MNDTERLQRILTALGPSQEFEPTRLEWLRALLSELPNLIDWNRCEDLEGTTDALNASCKLADLLTDLTRQEATNG